LVAGFPRSFLAESDEDSLAWREGFIRTFLERDIPHLGIAIPAAAMRRFWTMLAHYHGQIWNASELRCPVPGLFRVSFERRILSGQESTPLPKQGEFSYLKPWVRTVWSGGSPRS
jgi:hypothetical protein